MYRDRLKAAMWSMIDRKILNMNSSSKESVMGPRGLLFPRDMMLVRVTSGCRLLSALYILE